MLEQGNRSEKWREINLTDLDAFPPALSRKKKKMDFNCEMK